MIASLGAFVHAIPHPGLWLGVGLIALSFVLERRYRRSPRDSSPGPGWEPTAEVFQDGDSGLWMRVWYQPRTGERRYVPTQPPGG